MNSQNTKAIGGSNCSAPGAIGEAGGGRLYVDAMQHLMKQQAVDAAPHPAQLEWGGLPKLSDGENSGAVEPLLHARADAVDLLQFESEQNIGQVAGRDDDQPVRLLKIGTDLAEKHIQNSVVIVRIKPVIGLHRNDRGAKPPRLAHEGAGF